MSKVKWLLVAAAAAALVIQVIPVDRTNPSSAPSDSFLANHSVSVDVQATLRRACFDCHSNETRWPFYSHVAPVAWLVADDVHRGRRNVNFSEWGRYDEAKKADLLREAKEMVQEREMPLGMYVLLHPSAKLSPGDVERLVRVFEEQRRAALAPR